MKTKLELKDLKPNLYFTLSDTNTRKLCKMNDHYNIIFNPFSSRYEYYTAVKYANDWWMVNTFHIPVIAGGTYDIDRIIDAMKNEDEQARICMTIRSSHEDRLLVKLDEDTLQLFDFAFDLNEMQIIEERANDYNPKNLFFTKLFNDHMHDECLILAKKETKKDNRLAQENAAREFLELIIPPEYYSHAKSAFDERIKQIDKEELNEQLIEEIHRYDKLINKFVKELRKEKANFEYIDSISGKLKREV